MNARARHLLAQAALMPEASAQQLLPKTSSPGAETKAPHTAGESTYDWMAKLFRDCRTPRDWDRAIERAETELRRLRGHEKRKEAAVPPQARIVHWKGSAPDTVAQALNCTPTQVRRWRDAQGLDPETGSPHTRASRARALKALHPKMTLREIGRRLGVSHVTVKRDLERA